MAAPAIPSTPLALVCGEDDFGVKQRAREIFQKWSAELGGMDHEIIDAAVNNSGEALKALGKLREALQTLPFFGGGKAIWFQNCSFLGDDRTASSQAVTEHLASLGQELKTFKWGTVRLLISAGKVDKRKTFYKTVEKVGSVELFAGLSVDDKGWADQAEIFARRKLRELKKEISDEAAAELVANVGPNIRVLINEIEKLSLYLGDRTEVGLDDVSTIVTRNKQAKAFALGDALGDRDLPRLLKCLDEELWEMKTDKQKSEIGLLYGLIAKIRVLIFLKEMVDTSLLKKNYGQYDFGKFKLDLEKLPADTLPDDKRYNPLAMNPYILFKAMPQVARYSKPELIRAMELLLRCNQQLISSSADEAATLQQTLIKIARREA